LHLYRVSLSKAVAKVRTFRNSASLTPKFFPAFSVTGL
jgi:hypothetical protein